MTIQFVPRDRDFWALHAGMCVLTLLITVGTAMMWSSQPGYDIASSVAWLAPFTGCMLVFRWYFHRCNMHHWRISHLVWGCIAFSGAAGLVIAAVVTAGVLPLFWSGVASTQAASDPQFDAAEYVIRVIVRNALQSQLFVGGWAFIYVAVTNARRARGAEVSNLRLENSLKEAQLHNLANQLNPHFLFNALNNIRFMVHEDAKRADAMIVSLSSILRYSLESSRHDKVRLSDELAIVDGYISLVKTQLEDRLDFSLEVPQELHQCLIPPMVLQVLVENAIKHGMDQLRQGGRVAVRITQGAVGLQVEVRNDAPHADEPRRGVHGLGLGLSNVERRLRLLYGDRASVVTAPTQGQFVVRLCFPKEVP